MLLLPMASVKTAISVDSGLLQRIDSAARELDLPRSRLLARAAEEFLQRLDDQRLVAALDRAYGADPGAEEAELRRQVRPRHRSLVEGEW